MQSSELSSKHLFQKFATKSYKDFKPYIAEIFNQNQNAQNATVEVLQKVLVKRKDVNPTIMVSGLVYYKQLVVGATMDFITSEDIFPTSIHKAVADICKYNPKEKQFTERGNKYFADLFKVEANQENILAGKRFVLLALELVKSLAKWYPTEYDDDQVKSIFAFQYQQLSKTVAFPKFQEFLSLKPADQQNFKANYARFIKAMEESGVKQSQVVKQTKKQPVNTQKPVNSSQATQNNNEKKVQNPPNNILSSLTHKISTPEIVLTAPNKHKQNTKQSLFKPTEAAGLPGVVGDLVSRMRESAPAYGGELKNSGLPGVVGDLVSRMKESAPAYGGELKNSGLPGVVSDLVSRMRESAPAHNNIVGPASAEPAFGPSVIASIGSSTKPATGPAVGPGVGPAFEPSFGPAVVSSTGPATRPAIGPAIGPAAKSPQNANGTNQNKITDTIQMSSSFGGSLKEDSNKASKINHEMDISNLRNSKGSVIRQASSRSKSGQKQISSEYRQNQPQQPAGHIIQTKTSPHSFSKIIKPYPTAEEVGPAISDPKQQFTDAIKEDNPFVPTTPHKKIKKIQKPGEQLSPGRPKYNTMHGFYPNQRKRSIPKTEKIRNLNATLGGFKNFGGKGQSLVDNYKNFTNKRLSDWNNLRKSTQNSPQKPANDHVFSQLKTVQRQQIPFNPQYFSPVLPTNTVLKNQAINLFNSGTSSNNFYVGLQIQARLIKQSHTTFVLVLHNISQSMLEIGPNSQNQQQQVSKHIRFISWANNKNIVASRVPSKGFIDIKFMYQTTDFNLKFLPFWLKINGRSLQLNLPITILDLCSSDSVVSRQLLHQKIKKNGGILTSFPFKLGINMLPEFLGNKIISDIGMKQEYIGYTWLNLNRSSQKQQEDIHIFVRNIQQSPFVVQIEVLHQRNHAYQYNIAKTVLYLLMFLLGEK